MINNQEHIDIRISKYRSKKKVYFCKGNGDHRALHKAIRRQRQMCIKERLYNNNRKTERQEENNTSRATKQERRKTGEDREEGMRETENKTKRREK